ncbi:MAG: glycoside hydrolase family 15 protein [Geminicoccaceae bacterium]
MGTLDLGLIGNCTINALVDRDASIVWSCFPRFDGDPVFSSLLDEGAERGFFAIALNNATRREQEYIANTAVLVTRFWNDNGQGIEVIDFAPRFELFGRMHRPAQLVRMIRPLSESPRVTIRLRPHFDYGAEPPTVTRGSHHLRFSGGGQTLRLTTNAALTYLLEETLFIVDKPLAFFLGPDEPLNRSVEETAREFLEKTIAYWQQLSGRLHIPFEWQDAVIRSAITLKLCSFEETGAIIASPTTSMPEADGEGRNWDYRFCWLRDTYFVVRALNRLGYIETMSDYIVYLENLVAKSADGWLQPVFGIGGETALIERTVTTLMGYRGNQPIRVGNQAYEHAQHDGYGSVILAASQAFFDQRLRHPSGPAAFHRLERLGEKAWELHNVPDAGLWELRGRAHVHTHSAFMCWAACDRLARIATQLAIAERAAHWRGRADAIKATILEQAWSDRLGCFAASFGGHELDAALLLMHEVGFLPPDDPRFVATVEAIERELSDGPYVYRYKAADDFGEPAHAFLVCSFWLIDALVAIGRRERARELFERVLACRNHLGLLSEHVDRKSLELWGNFPQTYSHVGLINGAMRLSRAWEEVV